MFTKLNAVDGLLADKVLGQFRTVVVGSKHPDEENEDQKPDEKQGVDKRLEEADHQVQWIRDPRGVIDHPL